MATLEEYLEGRQCAFHSKNDKGRVLNIVKSQDENGVVWIPILLDEERRCKYDKWKNVVLGEEIVIADHMVRDLDTLKSVAAEGNYLDWKEGIIQWIEDDPPVRERLENAPENNTEKLFEKTQELFVALRQLVTEQMEKTSMIADQLASLPIMIQDVLQEQKKLLEKQEALQQGVEAIPSSLEEGMAPFEKGVMMALGSQQTKLAEMAVEVQTILQEVQLPIDQSELDRVGAVVKQVVQEVIAAQGRGKLALGHFQPFFGGA